MMEHLDVIKILEPRHLEMVRSAGDPRELAAELQPAIQDDNKDFFAAVEKAGTGSGDDGLGREERELVILGVMVASDTAEPLVAVHVYLALLFGASPRKIGNTLLLAGVYSGIPRYTRCLMVLRKVLLLLRRRIDREDELGTRVVVRELVGPLL